MKTLPPHNVHVFLPKALYDKVRARGKDRAFTQIVIEALNLWLKGKNR